MFDIEQPFAIIQREDSPQVLLLTGSVRRLDSLQEIPRRQCGGSGRRSCHTLSLIPFSQIREKGYSALVGDEKLLCLEVETQKEIPLSHLFSLIGERPVAFAEEPYFEESEEEYLRAVRAIIHDEIGRGAGSNFVLPRTCRGRIDAWSPAVGLSILRRLLEDDYGTYWKFAFFDGEAMFIGSTPEQHLAVENGTVTMNPISGTFRKAEFCSKDAAEEAFNRFLKDDKEIYELFMVVDEELKMMSEMCPQGGRVTGPSLREMSRLIHTEYRLEGKSHFDVIDLLRKSLFAATVTGSPVRSACDVIARYEKSPRRYYAAALALIGEDETGHEFLDSPILIRTVEVASSGVFQYRVGASLVRDSIATVELAETKAKGAAVLSALGATSRHVTVDESCPMLPELMRRGSRLIDTLSSRNEHLSSFWFEEQVAPGEGAPLRGRSILLVDNEDGFIHMLAHMLRALGADTELVAWADARSVAFSRDVLLIGPGPGDPRDADCRKMDTSFSLVREALARQHPLLAICLGHQLLGRALGLPIVRGEELHQGIQREVEFYGERERVGFYNTFWALEGATNHPAEIAKRDDGKLIGLRGRHFASLQFHAESVLSPNGLKLLLQSVQHALGECAPLALGA